MVKDKPLPVAIPKPTLAEHDRYVRERIRHDEEVDLIIRTRVPSKWRFVDLETGDVWKWDLTKRSFVKGGFP